MAETFKDKVEEAGHKIAETGDSKVGHKVGEKVEEATDWAKRKSPSGRQPHRGGGSRRSITRPRRCSAQERSGPGRSRISASTWTSSALAATSSRAGRGSSRRQSSIKLTRNDSPDGQHHLIPMSWVSRVDSQVHLGKNCGEAKREWQPA